MQNIRSDSTNNSSNAIIRPKNSVDDELRVEDDVPLMPIPRNLNCHGEFSQLDLGNAKLQPGLETPVDIYSYRDPLFEIRQIGMSIVYSVFASEC